MQLRDVCEDLPKDAFSESRWVHMLAHPSNVTVQALISKSPIERRIPEPANIVHQMHKQVVLREAMTSCCLIAFDVTDSALDQRTLHPLGHDMTVRADRLIERLDLLASS